MKKKNKKLDILMILTIIAGVLVLGAAGTLIGLEAGRLQTEVEMAKADREAKKSAADSGVSAAVAESSLSDEVGIYRKNLIGERPHGDCINQGDF